MLRRVPVTAALLALLSLLMLVPSIHAATDSDWRSARGFLYPALFGLFVAAGLGTLLRPMSVRETARHELITLLMIWVSLPIVASVPLVLITPSIGTSGAWFEMVAALTTTGGTVFSDHGSVPPSVQLWRGLMGWFGGLLTLLGAYVILAPRRLGGYEVMVAADSLGDDRSVDMRVAGAAFDDRTMRALKTILPIYGGMTAFLAIVFNVLDKPGLSAAVHAMSVVSTSGISSEDGGFAASRSYYAEAVALVFMVLAASRVFYAPAAQVGRKIGWRADPELRMMLVMAGLATAVLFLRHWVGVLTIDVDEIGSTDGFSALWGGFFTSISFITTTGFQSHAWESARDWSGLANPGLILLSLCAIGGGAATTAGGIKLIRAYALLRHGVRELERIAQPHSIAGSGAGPRGLRRQGALIAWTFMMLFILALVGSMLGLTLSGMRFSDALVASVAALSNTGPAFQLIAAEPLGFAVFDAVQHKILAAAMILGRIETLAVIALINPNEWPSRNAT
ncbi:MAG: potassium transporter TrkG [Pseudomonadota bacterium]